MAGAVAGIWNQLSTMHTAATAKPADTANSGDSGSNSASISANDFLTLLVTEMQNQDPTANTDPNEYINQLVQVNSLEQLISINQTLTADSAGVASDSSVPSSPRPVEFSASLQAATSSPPGSATAAKGSGNLTIPVANPAAIRVAQSLENH